VGILDGSLDGTLERVGISLLLSLGISDGRLNGALEGDRDGKSVSAGIVDGELDGICDRCSLGSDEGDCFIKFVGIAVGGRGLGIALGLYDGFPLGNMSFWLGGVVEGEGSIVGSSIKLGPYEGLLSLDHIVGINDGLGFIGVALGLPQLYLSFFNFLLLLSFFPLLFSPDFLSFFTLLPLSFLLFSLQPDFLLFVLLLLLLAFSLLYSSDLRIFLRFPGILPISELGESIF